MKDNAEITGHNISGKNRPFIVSSGSCIASFRTGHSDHTKYMSVCYQLQLSVNDNLNYSEPACIFYMLRNAFGKSFLHKENELAGAVYL